MAYGEPKKNGQMRVGLAHKGFPNIIHKNGKKITFLLIP